MFLVVMFIVLHVTLFRILPVMFYVFLFWALVSGRLTFVSRDFYY